MTYWSPCITQCESHTEIALICFICPGVLNREWDFESLFCEVLKSVVHFLRDLVQHLLILDQGCDDEGVVAQRVRDFSGFLRCLRSGRSILRFQLSTNLHVVDQRCFEHPRVIDLKPFKRDLDHLHLTKYLLQLSINTSLSLHPRIGPERHIPPLFNPLHLLQDRQRAYLKRGYLQLTQLTTLDINRLNDLVQLFFFFGDCMAATRVQARAEGFICVVVGSAH